MDQDEKHICDDALHEWLKAISEARAEAWERIPDIGLYMDQVIGYLNEQLSPFSATDEEPVLTPSMVNNYVKLGYLDRPEKKRYARRHLVTLYLLCSMKQTLPIPQAAFLISALTEGKDEGLEDMYRSVVATQKKAVDKLSAEMPTTADRRELLSSALSLTLEAEAMRLAAERIIATAMEAEKTEADAQEEATRAVERLAAKEEKRAAKAAAKAAR